MICVTRLLCSEVNCAFLITPENQELALGFFDFIFKNEVSACDILQNLNFLFVVESKHFQICA